MLQHHFPPIDEFFIFRTSEGDDMIMKLKPVVIKDIDYSISVLYYEKYIHSFITLVMEEMENMIKENIITSPHIIILWYDWKEEKVEEIETLDEIKFLTSKGNEKKNDFIFFRNSEIL